jgi:two-component system, NtrC family, nitrogen regulation sensor histidine kinase NtrY
MRLRTRLTLAFAALSVLPLLVSAPLVARRLRSTFDRELDRRADATSARVAADVQRLETHVAEAMTAAAQDSAAEALARAMEGPGPWPTADAARSLAEGRGLSVLALVDAQGRVRSSAHFPARTGDVDTGLHAALALPDGTVGVEDVQVAAPEGPRLWPALVCARPVEGVPGAFLVGGVLLDGTLATQLATASGAFVSLLRGEEVLASAGTAPGRQRVRVLPLGPGTSVSVAVGDAASAEAETALLSAFAAVVGAGLLLSFAVGAFLARRTTRPLEALTRGAEAVAAGQLQTRVDSPAQGELAVLVQAFNTMTGELSRTTRALVQAERIAAWEEVARSLAHELKNPLTPLQMSLETLCAAQASNSPRFEALFRAAAPAMREEVERLKRTVDAFARFARLPAAVLVPVDLGAWAEQALLLYGGDAGHRPEASLDSGLLVHADKDQLAQVLHNLLKNAEAATGPGGPPASVRVCARGPAVALEVEDRGPGIPAEARERIFEPHFSRTPGGSGLGLAIARRIATEHHGTLTVETGAHGGARFILLLPGLAPGGPA